MKHLWNELGTLSHHLARSTAVIGLSKLSVRQNSSDLCTEGTQGRLRISHKEQLECNQYRECSKTLLGLEAARELFLLRSLT